VIPVLALAYQLHGGIDYLHVEALGGLLAIDGLLLLIIALSPRSNNSLFSRVRNNGRDLDFITILVFFSTLLLINGLFDLRPSKDGSGLVAGIGTTPGEGVATLLGVFLLLVAMVTLFFFLVAEFLAGSPRTSNDHASAVAAFEAVAPHASISSSSRSYHKG
jgi:membrane protease YdiL (CAAX protease family)